ncbi:Phosphatidylinositol 4-phosphate 5-kinase 1 [Apostasia shenzhenica]|uniref:Phosphatidylinositol 4-phosphate 5-kinase 1 n=1 Tax=Apostasia shenzhenica TaxID=1088818 RepID=A0A2I0A0R3_9ASPA|nr:Phosphatidylinositol 4-phosphate 5-kinase 1 [Apostasia shenzhenica]
MEGQHSKLTRTPSSLLRSPTLRSSAHSLCALAEVSSDPEEVKPHSPPPSAASTGFPPRRGTGGSGHCLAVLSSLLILLLLLSFLYLHDHSPSLWNLSLASAAVAAASLALKRSRFYLTRRRHRRSESVRWFIGDEEGDLENALPTKGERAVREGVEFYSNGDFYEGEFHKGKCSGSGVYNFFGQGRYEGDWVDGQYDGYGIERWAKGSRYRGQYRHGLRQGFGMYRFYNGDSYAGEWVGGQSHGRGVQSCSDGSSYAGEFKCGVKHGLGFYHFSFEVLIAFVCWKLEKILRNGDRYAGEYFGDKIHGFGVYHFANGHCYEGSWHEGRRQGFGTYNFRKGEAKSGEWDCGALKNPLPTSDPSVHRASQSARKASEKAILLPRVDDHVNKAIAAANRAATAARVAAIKAVQNRMNGKFCNTEV